MKNVKLKILGIVLAMEMGCLTAYARDIARIEGVSANDPAAVYEYTNIDVCQTVNAVVAAPGEYVYFCFMPNESREYTFYSYGRNDTYGCVYDENMVLLASDDDEGEGLNFGITYDMQAGKRYYLGAKFYSNIRTGSISCFLLAKDMLPETRLPAELTVIDEEAFQGTLIRMICISESVKAIGREAIPKNTIIFTPGSSYARTWAVNNGYPIVLQSEED